MSLANLSASMDESLANEVHTKVPPETAEADEPPSIRGRSAWYLLACAAIFAGVAWVASQPLPAIAGISQPTSFGPFTGQDLEQFIHERAAPSDLETRDRLLTLAREAGDRPFVPFVRQKYGSIAEATAAGGTDTPG